MESSYLYFRYVNTVTDETKIFKKREWTLNFNFDCDKFKNNT